MVADTSNNILSVPPTALYVHVPFCVSKCSYCDFISYPYQEADALLYLDALGKEMEMQRQLHNSAANKNWTVSTVFIGGGTPTCLSTAMLLAIISLIKEHFNLSPNVEFTVEANPGTVDYAKLRALRTCGVNRLSLGAQSFNQTTLNVLGRIHTPEQTIMAVHQAREAGFDNLNLDLIFEVPGQTSADWERSLEQTLILAPEHISAYSLQLEEGTYLTRQVAQGRLVACAEEEGLAMYRKAINTLQKAGLVQYEISNFALPGRQCRHNLVYWQNEAYLGLGPAAHSRLGNMRRSNIPEITQYAAQLKAGLAPYNWSEELKETDDIFETVFLALRMTQGLDLECFKKRFGCSIEQIYPGLTEKLIRQGLLENRENYLRLTDLGRELANLVMSEFAFDFS